MNKKTQKLFICILAVVCGLSVLLGLSACKKVYDMSGVTFTDKTVEYNRQKQSLTIEGILPEGVSVEYNYYSDAEHTKRVNGAVSVGTYYVVASFTSDDEGYEPIADMTAILTITVGNYDMSEVKFENKVVQYSGEPQTVTVTGTLPTGVKVAYEYYADAEHKNKIEAANVVNVGTYYVVASFTGAEGYNKPADKTATLTISKLDLSGISFTDKSVPYSGEPQSIAISGTLPDALTVSYEYYSDDKYTVKVDADKVINAGTYYVKAIIAGKDASEQETLTAKLTITPVAAGTVVLTDKTVDYNGTTQSLAIVGTLPAGVTVTYHYYTDAKRTQVAQSVVDVGTYYVTAKFQSTGSYVAPDDLNATLTITKVAFASVDFSLKGVYNEGEQDSTTIAVRQEDKDTWYVEYMAQECAIRLDAYSANGDSNVARPKIEYFRTMNADGTLSDATPTNNSVTNFGDIIYVRVTFSDKNHTETSVVRKITVFKRTFELSTFEDLKIMRAHIFGGTVNGQTIEPLPRGFRKDVRYVLKNDIDCQGQLWTPVQIAVKGSITASVMETNAFCSEFDGKGYAISNYKITGDSLDMDEIKSQQIDAVTRVHVGFFGYVNECEIHDVTFSNVNITLDRTFVEQDFSNPNVANSGTGDVIYYVGVVTGRLDSNRSQAFNDPSDLYNITVSNCKINLEGKRIYAGGIIGIEYIGPGEDGVNLFGKRNNLNVVDCVMYGSRSSGASEVAMGGLIGRIAFDSTGPNETYVVTDSSVKNIKIGYNVEAYLEADEEDKAALLPAASISVGAYFGNVPLLNMRFVDCSLENYLIGTSTKTGLTSKRGSLTIDDVVYYAKFQTVNFERKQDATWNGGVNGAYNANGQPVEDNQANADFFDWGTAVDAD